ncbi:MAG: chemotaxis protein CheA, partial [Deltaproteobacteria bacterium]
MESFNKVSEMALNDFIAESDEIIQRVSDHMGQIEKGQASHEVIDDLYRSIHTLKGSSQLFGFKELGDLAHALETCLDPLRHGGKGVQESLLQSIYGCIDLIEKMVRNIQLRENTSFKGELERVIPSLIEKSLLNFGQDFKLKKEQLNFKEDLTVSKPKEDLKVDLTVSKTNEVSTVPLTPILKEEVPMSSKTVSLEEPLVSSKEASTEPSAPAAHTDSANSEANSTVRVPVVLLDKLMTLMGEMVLVRNQVLQYSNQRDDLEFLNLSQRLDIVTSELQGEVMKTRMQPIGNVLSKFQRVIRDLSKELGKKIELNLIGVETELDKTLLEAIKDPLTHIVRNSCDHGIESIEDRKKSGKPEIGHVTIRAFHEGGQVIIEINDDGRGLSRDKLIAKAIEKNLTTPDKAALLSDRDACNFIFAPGFSTAAKVTNLSGRGVGMDVVKSNIEKIGGQVELTSVFGKGITIRLKIPLTLAIVPAMIVRCGENRYAIPQVKLVELVRVENNGTGEQVEYLQGKPMYRLRGNLLPLVNLKEILESEKEPQRAAQTVTNIVVLNSERQMFGLIVDEIQDTADIVVKPLSQFLKSLSIYSGATVLGDGSVSLILDVIGLSQYANLVSDKVLDKESEKAALDRKGRFDDVQEYLLFRINRYGKYAVPLNLVQRLEEFKGSSIEYSGEQRVVRYRGAVIPIISLNESLKFNTEGEVPSKNENLSVIVVQKGGRVYGIEVDEIIDVASLDANIDDSVLDRPGILGNIIQNDE